MMMFMARKEQLTIRCMTDDKLVCKVFNYSIGYARMTVLCQYSLPGRGGGMPMPPGGGGTAQQDSTQGRLSAGALVVQKITRHAASTHWHWRF